jgi:peptide chain release factor 1
MDWANRLEEIEQRYNQLSEEMADPDAMRDQSAYQKAAKAASDISEVVTKYQAWKEAKQALEEATELLQSGDPDMVELAQEEAESQRARVADIEEELRVLLLPTDPNDDKGVVLEVRAGTGGSEATLFAAEIFRMYTRYAEVNRWKVEVLSSSESEVGGFKEIIALITGDRVYSRMKFESGVHRVQRVPQTETQGRVHTSAVTVAVLPQAEEVDVEIDPTEIRVDTFCSSGPGGQSVNTTYSAIRITHLPTGLVVSCQDEKSQLKNRKKAMVVLRSRLLELEQSKQHDAEADARRSMVGTGDRSEKIRTYNFPQQRVTDHRIGLTLHQLDLVMEGRIDSLIDALVSYNQTQLLKGEPVAS